jgi:hypothetical protein
MRLKVPPIPLNFWSIPRVRVSFHMTTCRACNSVGTARSVGLIGYGAASSRERRTLKPCLGDSHAELPAWGWPHLSARGASRSFGTAAPAMHRWLASQMGRLSTADWPDTAPGVDVWGVGIKVGASGIKPAGFDATTTTVGSLEVQHEDTHRLTKSPMQIYKQHLCQPNNEPYI